MTSVGKVQRARGPRLLRLYGGLLDDDYLNAGDSGVRSARGWLASEAYNSLFSEIVGVFRQFRREHPGKPRESTTEQKLIQRVLTALGWTYGDRLPLGPPGTGGKPDYPPSGSLSP